MSSLHLQLKLDRSTFSLEVDVNIPLEGVSVICGESGAGKTTLLRCIAGLEKAEGKIQMNGVLWQDTQNHVVVPTSKRAIGYVFQEAGIFPHLTVRQNIEFGWKRNHTKHKKIQWDDVIHWLKLAPLLDHTSTTLSSGQKQRVAIARALLTSPQILLLDEPLASLDFRGKLEILDYLLLLHQKLSIPIVYVSHSFEEVSHIADYMLVMKDGKISESGTFPQILSSLSLPWSVASFAGAVIETTVQSHDSQHHLTYLQMGEEQFTVVRQHFEVGTTIRIRIPATSISLTLQKHEDSSMVNIFSGTILRWSEYQQSEYIVHLQVQQLILFALITKEALDRLDLRLHQSVFVQVNHVILL